MLTLEIKLSDMKAVDKGCDKFVLAQEEIGHVVLQKEPFFKTPDMAEDEVATFEDAGTCAREFLEATCSHNDVILLITGRGRGLRMLG